MTIFIFVPGTGLCQKIMLAYVAHSLSLFLFHIPSMCNHGNLDNFCVSPSCTKAFHLKLKSVFFVHVYMKEKNRIKSMRQRRLCDFWFSLTAADASTYLHYVIDQRVAEHPVQVDALILQNVLENNQWKGAGNVHTQERKKMFSLLSFQDGLGVYVGTECRTTFSPSSLWHMQPCRMLKNNLASDWNLNSGCDYLSLAQHPSLRDKVPGWIPFSFPACPFQ